MFQLKLTKATFKMVASLSQFVDVIVKNIRSIVHILMQFFITFWVWKQNICVPPIQYSLGTESIETYQRFFMGQFGHECDFLTVRALQNGFCGRYEIRKFWSRFKLATKIIFILKLIRWNVLHVKVTRVEQQILRS